jgi:hypothetical protein
MTIREIRFLITIRTNLISRMFGSVSTLEHSAFYKFSFVDVYPLLSSRLLPPMVNLMAIGRTYLRQSGASSGQVECTSPIKTITLNH